MSLKAFHVFFMVVCTVFLAGFAWWGLNDGLHGGSAVNLAMGAGSAAGCIGLAFYSRWFIRKTKHVSYL